ncbi:MAG: 3-hydroxyacyl-CoA dehydrogenase NAD-binding domain-containing protein [Candidatus Neomarinimicrobiota bacterium]|nr:3-hydroxyacyl-CoA dehydrogenase NAD-binding domain-containing protein [Candidatus Neomarinimicrobiota bacterium]
MNPPISIMGAGTMGLGIAQLAASHGEDVILFDIDQKVLDLSKEKLLNTLNNLLKKKKISIDEKDKIMDKINWTVNIKDISKSFMVIEAVIENLEIKKKLFYDMESLVSNECILATNTSSLSVSKIASECKKPQRILGIHFFNPVPIMQLVELIPIDQTQLKLKEMVKNKIESWNKIVVTAKDTPGFIVNRLARPFYGEALRIYEEGIADCSTIDWAMKKMGKFRMGPFELMDFIGIDVNYMATESVFIGLNHNPRYTPSPLQKKLLDEGKLGRKSGEGFYKYQEGAIKPEPNKDEKLGKKIFNRILSMLINGAIEALHLQIGSKEDIDIAMSKGVNYPKGLLRWGDEWGLDNVLNQLMDLYDFYGDDRYEPSLLLKNKVNNKTFFYA